MLRLRRRNAPTSKFMPRNSVTYSITCARFQSLSLYYLWSYLWNAVAPYSTFRLRSLCVNGCLPRSSCVNGCLPNTLLTCQDVPGSHYAFLCRVKGHTLTSCARRRGSLGTRLHTLALCIYCACAYECLAAPSRPSPVSRLFHAGCTSS